MRHQGTRFAYRWIGRGTTFTCAAVAAVTIAALAIPAGAAEQPSAAATFGEETSVIVVEVPVEVTRDGKPVAGLAQADFEVREHGKPLRIVGFEQVEVGTDAGAATTGAAAPVPSLAARRHVFLLFDLAFSRRERLRDAVASARQLLANGLDASDLVAVAVYTPRGDLPILLSFTADRAAAGRALDAVGEAIDGKPASQPAAGARRDPLRLTGLGSSAILAEAWPVDERNVLAEFLEDLGPLESTAIARGGARRSTGGNFLQRNSMNHSRILQEPNVRERMRAHVRSMNEGMRQLSTALRGVDGRKYLAFFSEGFASNLMDVTTSGPQNPSFGGSDVLSVMNKTLGELRRSGWVVHTVDIAGTRRSLFGSDALFFIANETGGTLVRGTNDFAAGLGKALAPSAHVYVLGVQVDATPNDGAFHALEVKVRGAGRGTVVRHRPGYFAAQTFAERPPIERLADAATLIAGGEPRDELGVSVVAAPLRAGGDSTRVGVVVEVPGAALPAAAAHGGLEVYGYAMDAGGRSSDFFSYAVDLDRRQLDARLAAGGVRFVAALDLPSRWHELRLLVRERSAGRYSLLAVPIDAAPATGANGELAALFLPADHDPWLVVRDPAADGFTLHGRALVPAVRPQLPAAGDAQVLLVGRGLTGDGAALRTRIFDAQGKAVAKGSLEVLSVTPGAGGEPDLAVARLHADGLPSGEYRLEVVLAEGGRARAATSGRFRVGT